jgi:hypothetical protein
MWVWFLVAALPHACEWEYHAYAAEMWEGHNHAAVAQQRDAAEPRLLAAEARCAALEVSFFALLLLCRMRVSGNVTRTWHRRGFWQQKRRALQLLSIGVFGVVLCSTDVSMAA